MNSGQVIPCYELQSFRQGQSLVQAALNLQVPPEHSKEVMDCKQLLKTLIMGNDFIALIRS